MAIHERVRQLRAWWHPEERAWETTPPKERKKRRESIWFRHGQTRLTVDVNRLWRSAGTGAFL